MLFGEWGILYNQVGLGMVVLGRLSKLYISVIIWLLCGILQSFIPSIIVHAFISHNTFCLNSSWYLAHLVKSHFRGHTLYVTLLRSSLLNHY